VTKTGHLAPSIVTLAGGVGAARMLTGLELSFPGANTAVVNTGDDTVMHGLHISPDLDTVTYTLAGAINTELGWGLAGETWQAMEALEAYGGESWFRLGDRDLATHLYRTQRLRDGATLSEVTREIIDRWGLTVTLMPMTDDPVRTMVDTPSQGELSFQEYFVKHQHGIEVGAIRFDGAEVSAPAPGAIDALKEADVVVIAPSNPIVSIGPLLAVPGLRETVVARRDQVVAVSPIVAGAALKGPADRLMRELGHEPSVVGVARLYRDLASVLVIDGADASLADAVEAEGMTCMVTETIMSTPEVAASLAHDVVGATGAVISGAGGS
jgi:LPPG:FO 2-phospho-L-lactate transferase